MKTPTLLKNIMLLSSVVFISASLTNVVNAKSPYYFVDDINNKQSLYTRSNCNREKKNCVGFGTKCGTRLYLSRYSLGQAKDLWRYKGRINIRINSGSYKIVCKMKRK